MFSVQPQRRNKLPLWQTLALSFCLASGLGTARGVQAKAYNLEVGIVQRFGEEATDTLTLAAPQGEILTLRFMGGNMQPKTLQTQAVTVEIAKYPLQNTKVREYLVLSDHATFETAEDSAKRFKAQGIEVEITQPGRWQVWAKREVYQTPLLRRLLLNNLKERGNTTAYLDTEVVEAVPRISFVVDGYRYNRKRLEVSSQSNKIQVSTDDDTKVYGGTVEIQPNAYGTYTLVNDVPLETYLRGVVPHEIGTSAPDEAIKAQTIIARTYALRNLRRFEADNYQLCANTHCQVYKGLTATYGRADRAIEATTGQVLTYDNELVDALYSSTTGGVTARFSDIWNGSERPYLKSVIDSPQEVWDLNQASLADETVFRNFINLKRGFNETGTVAFRWNRSSSLENLTKDLQKYLKNTQHPLANFTQIKKMEVTERSPSGRILEMMVDTDLGQVALHKTEVRSAFYPPRSTLFYLTPIYEADQTLKGYNFVGGGFGHGVGMSQYGSYNLANLGWSAENILGFYYPNTEIRQLDNSIVLYATDRFEFD
jgi:SpoIID/LytB domain protein